MLMPIQNASQVAKIIFSFVYISKANAMYHHIKHLYIRKYIYPAVVGSVHIANNIIKRLGDIDNVIWAH